MRSNTTHVKSRIVVGHVVVITLVLMSCYLLRVLWKIPTFVLPTPLGVGRYIFRAAWSYPVSPDSLWYAIAYTLVEAVAGFALGSVVAILCGIVYVRFPRFERATMPLLMGFHAIPKVAFAPLVIIWFGLGITSKIVLAALLAYFPVLINSVNGLKSVDAAQLELARFYRMDHKRLIWHFRLPHALPAIWNGVDIAFLFAMTGAIIGEFFGGQHGLGVELLRRIFEFNSSGAFGTLLVLSFVGAAYSLLSRAIRRRVLFWSASKS